MDNSELMFRVVEIVIASIGVITGTLLVFFGLIVPRKTENLRSKNEDNAERMRWKKDLINRQISNLYGPLYALIIEDSIMFSRIQYQLGRKVIIPKGMSFSELPEDEQDKWIHYVDTYKINRQVKMSEIICNNIHLTYKSEFPTCFKTFLDYSLGWELLDNQKRSGIHNYYEYHYCYNYPTEFNHYVRTTLETLLNEQSALSEVTDAKVADVSIY